MKKNKLKIIFDLDGTLTKYETLPMIAKLCSVESKISNLTDETIKGNIPYIESFIRRIHILKNFPIDKISDLLLDVPIYTQISNFILEYKEHCIIATGNLDCWSASLLKNFGCEYYTSKAKIENNRIIRLLNILRKEDIVKLYKEKKYKVIFVGEGNNDQEAMRQSDISIASGLVHKPAKSVLEICDYSVFSEEALCRLLKQLL